MDMRKKCWDWSTKMELVVVGKQMILKSKWMMAQRTLETI